MDSKLSSSSLRPEIERFMMEDDLQDNFYYFSELPRESVDCHLYFKSSMRVAGLNYFLECFRYLGAKITNSEEFTKFEGKDVEFEEGKGPQSLDFILPFGVALTGERVALNLLQRASMVATATRDLVEKTKEHGIKILDTRKTTPGLRTLEKYAVKVGGGHNHRFGQCDAWMIKDNHKSFFGSLENALEFFNRVKGMYQPIICEIHNLDELEEALKLNVRHCLLDNFSPDLVKEAIKMRGDHEVTYEISGGIDSNSIESYLIRGIDAISVGSITQAPGRVDISLKFERT